MACPLCGDRCTCSFTANATRVGASAPPSLSYEYDDEYRHDERRTQVKTELLMAVILGKDAAASVPEVGAPAAFESKDPLFSEHTPALPEDLALESDRVHEQEEVSPLWKQEVASCLESYRARRGSRRPRYNTSLSLDFERATNRMVASAVTDEEISQDVALASSRQVLEQPVPTEDDRNEFFGAANDIPEPEAWSPAPAARDQRPPTKVIEFPRLLTLFDMAPTGNELADPVADKPRILYVSEEVPTAQAPLADIQIDPEVWPSLPEVELLLRVAPVKKRVFAALADALIVLTGATIFMAIVLREVPAPNSNLGYALVAALPAVFWAIYEYLFLVHCAATPGMQMAHLALASFDSEPIGRRLRRARALAWMLSTFPLGLGLIWALLDEDTLCWHDRISRTYLIVPMREHDD